MSSSISPTEGDVQANRARAARRSGSTCHTPPWFRDPRIPPDVLSHAAALNREVRHGHLACPACGEQRRSREDSRLGPAYLTHQGRRWRCDRCGAHGDGSDLVSYVLTGERLGRGSAAQVRARTAGWGWCEPAPDAPPVVVVAPREPAPVEAPSGPPPTDEVRALWARSPRRLPEKIANKLREERGLDPSGMEDEDPVRVLLSQERLPDCVRNFRWFKVDLIAPLYNARGELGGLQGRSFRHPKKSVRMMGVTCKGLVLASKVARMVLETGAWPEWVEEDARCIEVVEGEPDFWTVLAKRHGARPGAIVLGIPGEGAWTQQIADRIPDGARVEVATHQDVAGESYAALVKATLHPRCRVFRVRWAA